MREPTLYIVTAPFTAGGTRLLLDESHQWGMYWIRPDDASLWAAHNAPPGWKVAPMKVALPLGQQSAAVSIAPQEEGKPNG